MQAQVDRQSIRRRIRYRIRKKVSGTAQRPRLAVFRSSKHIYVQAIDDGRGHTLAHSSSRDAVIRSAVPSGGNIAAAKQVGGAIAAKLKSAGIDSVVFDRGGHLYHGRVRAVADAVREAGIKL